ncbi:glycosyl hydrolase family 28-related protein, partial [Limosilactobacillus reuteri]|uniref:glycosyl hydrolase family 28-related protein n=1 Tax=Limosilactobacillus reuteri TaxID=1598 RepID=UPI002AFF2FC8
MMVFRALKGEKGDRGPAGPQGIQGPKGDPGQIPDVSNINKGISDNKSDISKINLKMSTMFVNLLDFGAQPENVNFDNAPAFNKAIQALPSVGGTIFIPNGNYFLKSTVNIDRSYVHVMGLNHGLRSGIDPVDGSTQAGGGGAKVTVQNPITAFKLENTHNSNRLSGITFSGFDLRGDTNAGVGIDGVSNTDRVVIDNMTINNVGIGVRLHAADAPRITNSWIAETQSSILLTGASQQAEIKNNSLGAQPKGTTIYMENPDRFKFSGNNY